MLGRWIVAAALAAGALALGCDRGGAPEQDSAAESLFRSLNVMDGTPVNTPMPPGTSGGPTALPPPGPPGLALPGQMVQFPVPWSGGGITGVNIGFTDQSSGAALPGQYFQVPVPPAMANMPQGTVMVQAMVSPDVCRNLANICHQIRCYEQVRLPDGTTVSRAAAVSMALDCGNNACGGGLPRDGGVRDGGNMCSSQQSSGSDSDSRVIQLGRSSGMITLMYDMFAIEDRMIVTYEGRQIMDTGCVANAGSTSASYSGTATSATVQIMGNCATGGGTGSSWNFTLSCPTP